MTTQPNDLPAYPVESAGSIMSANVLTTHKSHELHDILVAIASRSWDDIQYIYVLDVSGRLVGVVDLARFSKAEAKVRVGDLMIPPMVTVRPHDDQEKAVLLAIEHDVTALPVVDDEGIFLGAIPARKIIDVMHQEHLEDALLTSGIRGRGSHILKLATSRYRVVVASRVPWLIMGTLVGLGLGLISSLFERTLQESLALAYFVPVVAYIADSVGTQSEAITIRALATLKLRYGLYMLRELVIGVVLGATLGAVGALGAMVISRSLSIGLVVGLSLFVACVIASVLASLLPIVFKLMGRDPALGSGPLATALQDMISVLVYFAFAVWLI